VYALMLTQELAPDHAEDLRQHLVARLGAGNRGVRALVLAITEAGDKETVLGLASLADLIGKDDVCAAFEQIALGQRTPPHWQSDGFWAIRNTITAYGAIAPDRARAFFRSLLTHDQDPVRHVGIYGVGELRVAEAVPELLPLVTPEYENCFRADCVSVALAKISTPEAHQALLDMLAREPVDIRYAWEVAVSMCAVCGTEGRSPQGAWWNGCWATVPDDLPSVARRFADALNALAERTTDDRLAREARGRADSCLRAAAQR